ncbi:MAG: response regulator [Candidatus Berkelbacteria bacterium]
MSDIFLVVDDNEGARCGFSYLLKFGFPSSRILEACNGKEALDLFIANPGISLIFTDHQMPRMTGIDLTKNIRLSDKKVKIIVTSGFEGILVPALEAGANAFIQKPPSPQDVIKIVKELLETEELEE